LPPEPPPARAPRPKLRLRARPLGRRSSRSACWERGQRLVVTPVAGRREPTAALVAPSGARRVDGDIASAAGALAVFAWLRVLCAAATPRRVASRGFGRGEWQRARTSSLRWPAKVFFASAEGAEAAGGSPLWRPEGAVVMERHSTAFCVVASSHPGEAQRHRPLSLDCRDVRIRRTARGAA